MFTIMSMIELMTLLLSARFPSSGEMFEEHGFSLDQAKGIIHKSFMG